MKAVQLENPHGVKKGERLVVAVRDVPIPTLHDNMVLFKILAAGMNRRDEWSALGLYPGLVFENSTLGCDGCGVIVDPKTLEPEPNAQLYLLTPSRGWEEDLAGPETALPNALPQVRKNEFGGEGFGILGATRAVRGAGTFAEYIGVDRSQLVPAPKHLSAVQSASLPCAAVTAYRAAFTKGTIQRGQNVLITGIGGGVAMLAMQLVLAAGANVYVTGGSEAKIERAKAMGAKAGALYRAQDWPQQLRKMLPVDRPYFDVVIDSAGGEIGAQALQAGLRDGGHVVVYGMTAVPKTTFTMRDVLKNLNLQGRSQTHTGTTLGSAKEFSESIRFIEQHQIEPRIDTVLDGLDKVQQGLALLADAEKRSGGKVVLNIAAAPRAVL